MKKKEYCTQNDGDCKTCSLVNYGMDCQNNPIGTVSMIIRNVPESLRRDFKARCAQDGISQQAKIIELMRGYLK